MVVATTLDVRQAALSRYDLPVLASSVSLSALRSGVDASTVVSGDRGADRIGDASLRRGEAYGLRTERWQADPSEIRDRVTISSEAYARTAPRHITYDRSGNLSSIVQPAVSTGAAAHAETIRDQVTLVVKPPPDAVRRGVGAEPPQLLVWFTASTIPEPA